MQPWLATLLIAATLCIASPRSAFANAGGSPAFDAMLARINELEATLASA